MPRLPLWSLCRIASDPPRPDPWGCVDLRAESHVGRIIVYSVLNEKDRFVRRWRRLDCRSRQAEQRAAGPKDRPLGAQGVQIRASNLGF